MRDPTTACSDRIARAANVRGWLPPLAALIVARLTTSAVAWANGFHPLHAATWARYDSHQYLWIALHGYYISPCRPETGLPPTMFCGSTGWFPAYPWLIALLSSAGGDPACWGELLALVAHGAMLVVLWRSFLGASIDPRRIGALTLAAFFPGGVYYQAVFPISLFLLLAMTFLLACEHERWWAAAGWGGAAALMYSTGFLLAAAYGGCALASARGRRKDWRRLLPVAGVALGFAAAVTVIAWPTGRWDAFFVTQAAYGYALSNPVHTLATRVAPVFARIPSGAGFVTGCQSLLVVAIVAVTLANALRKRGSALACLVGAYGAVFFFFPLLVGGRVSLYRAESLLLPCVALVREASPFTIALLTIVAAALAPPIANAFFRGLLV